MTTRSAAHHEVRCSRKHEAAGPCAVAAHHAPAITQGWALTLTSPTHRPHWHPPIAPTGTHPPPAAVRQSPQG